jgi:hypothetical protein
MIPRHPSGTLLNKSAPVGAAGKRAPVAASTSTSSPALPLSRFKVGACLSGNTRARCRISQAIGLAGCGAPRPKIDHRGADHWHGDSRTIPLKTLAHRDGSPLDVSSRRFLIGISSSLESVFLAISAII